MTNKCMTRMDRRELYKVRDLPQGEREKGAQFPSSCPWWIRPDGNSYPRTRSSFPRIVSPSTSMFLTPTWSSPTYALTVVSSKPNPWTHSLQIHCNGSAGPGSHPSMGPSPKIATLHIYIYIYIFFFLVNHILFFRLNSIWLLSPLILYH